MKTILITGATSGIGKACAKVFAQNGYALILTGRRNERLVELKLELQSLCDNIETLCFDVQNQEQVRSALSTIQNRKIDVLLNNAGLSQGLNPVHDAPMEDFEIMLDTNVKGLLYVTKEILPRMIKQKSGHIINISSVAGKEVYPNGNVYCASKHAVEAISKAMRMELLPHGIKVGTVSPGLVETEFSLVRFKGDEERAKTVYQGYQPLNAEDVADAVWYMASRPEHVNIADILIFPKAQASSMHVQKEA